MRSRDVRPFTVEFKSKRRPAANLSPSIWGNTAKHFGIAPDPAPDRPPLSIEKLIFTPAPPEAHQGPKVQTIRILPDLRVAQVKVDTEIVAVRVRRIPRKKGGNTMLHDTEKRDEHQMEFASTATNLSDDPNPINEVESSELLQALEDHGSIDASLTAKNVQLAQEVQVAARDTPIAISPMTVQRGRRWMRGVQELPRGERWKRRLPEVCR